MTHIHQFHQPDFYDMCLCFNDIYYYIYDIYYYIYDMSWWHKRVMTHTTLLWHIVVYWWHMYQFLWHILMTQALMTYPMTYSDHHDISSWHMNVMTYPMTCTQWHITCVTMTYSFANHDIHDICNDISWWHVICHAMCHENFGYVMVWYVMAICHRGFFFTDVLVVSHTFSDDVRSNI